MSQGSSQVSLMSGTEKCSLTVKVFNLDRQILTSGFCLGTTDISNSGCPNVLVLSILPSCPLHHPCPLISPSSCHSPSISFPLSHVLLCPKEDVHGERETLGNSHKFLWSPTQHSMPSALNNVEVTLNFKSFISHPRGVATCSPHGSVNQELQEWSCQHLGERTKE